MAAHRVPPLALQLQDIVRANAALHPHNPGGGVPARLVGKLFHERFRRPLLLAPGQSMGDLLDRMPGLQTYFPAGPTDMYVRCTAVYPAAPPPPPPPPQPQPQLQPQPQPQRDPRARPRTLQLVKELTAGTSLGYPTTGIPLNKVAGLYQQRFGVALERGGLRMTEFVQSVRGLELFLADPREPHKMSVRLLQGPQQQRQQSQHRHHQLALSSPHPAGAAMATHHAAAAAAGVGAEAAPPDLATSSSLWTTRAGVVEELTTVVAWHNERVPLAPAPVHVLAACDCSGSMAGRGIREAGDGMEALAAALKAHGSDGDKLSAWGFNSAVEELLPPNTPAAAVDSAALRARLARAVGGQTALFDGIARPLAGVRDALAGGARFVECFVLTDGLDTVGSSSSPTNTEECVRRLLADVATMAARPHTARRGGSSSSGGGGAAADSTAGDVGVDGNDGYDDDDDAGPGRVHVMMVYVGSDIAGAEALVRVASGHEHFVKVKAFSNDWGNIAKAFDRFVTSMTKRVRTTTTTVMRRRLSSSNSVATGGGGSASAGGGAGGRGTAQDQQHQHRQRHQHNSPPPPRALLQPFHQSPPQPQPHQHPFMQRQQQQQQQPFAPPPPSLQYQQWPSSSPPPPPQQQQQWQYHMAAPVPRNIPRW